MKKTLLFLFFFFISATSLLSQTERYDSLYTVASSVNFNYRNPGFEEKDLYSYFSNDITLTYEKRDTLNSKSNIVYRKADANGIGPEVMITNDNFLNLNPAASHTMIVWHTNRNSDLNIYYSVYSNSVWSAAAPLGLSPAYELNASVAEAVINNNTAYYIVYESNGDVFLKVLYQGSLLIDSNLTANVSEACSSPKIKYKNNLRQLYISYLKNVNPVKRIVIIPANVNTDFSISWQSAREIIQNGSAGNIGFVNGGFFLEGFLTYDYDTLGSAHSMGIDLTGYSKVIFTDQFPGRNYNGTGGFFPIITDNSNSMNYFTTFGWNRKSSDSSFIVAAVSYPSIVRKFYLGDSSVTAKPDVSDYVINSLNHTTLFRIVWEQKINGRYVIMESRYSDFLSGISNQNLNAPEYSLSQNFPNPFNPSTHLEFGIPKLEFVSLKVYDILGKEVAILVNEKLNPGIYNYQFSTVSYQLSSGIYFYKLEAGDYVETKRMVLLK